MLRLITCMDRGAGCFSALVRSAHRFGADLEVLAPEGPWLGLTTKLHLMQGSLERDAGDSEVVAFCDAHDCVVVRDVVEMAAEFQAMAVDIVMAAETNLAPYPEQRSRYPGSPTRCRYLNSGAYVGYAGALRAMFDDMGLWRIPETLNDQGVVTDWWLANEVRIALDYECRLFGCLFGAEGDYDYGARGVVNRLTGGRPFILHGNGHADMGRALAWLERSALSM